MKIYQVGGAVRDKLLGLDPHDFDYVVVGATPEQMNSLGYKEVGRGFPVFLHPETKEEYALARKEIKSGRKHTDFDFIFTPDISLREDLERRDFTCNAMAFDAQTGEIIDYFGGREDIENRVLRVVNPLHFIEDPLRVLRMCRFSAQLGFAPLPQTLELCRQMTADDMLADLTAERVWAEWLKALRTSRFDVFIKLLRDVNASGLFLPPFDDDVLAVLKRAAYLPSLVKLAVLMIEVKMTDNSVEDFCRQLKTPNEFKDFLFMAVKQVKLFEQLLTFDGEKMYETAKTMIIRHISYAEEFLEVCHVIYPYDRYFEQKAQILRTACGVLRNTKATELPGFSEMPKDAVFKMRLKDYLIEKIERMTAKLR